MAIQVVAQTSRPDIECIISVAAFLALGVLKAPSHCALDSRIQSDEFWSV